MDNTVSAMVRAVRVRKGMRQADLAQLAGVSRSLVKLERGALSNLQLDAIERIAGAIDIRLSLRCRWQGGDGDRLINWRHSRLANAIVKELRRHGWMAESEVSFSIYGERGFIDILARHPGTGELLVIELKTEFVEINEMLGVTDRKVRLATQIAIQRGWNPRAVSLWLIVSDTRTNRRHAAGHGTLLRNSFPLDGRSFRSFLARPEPATRGMVFWPDAPRGVVVTDGSGIRPPVRRSASHSIASSAPEPVDHARKPPVGGLPARPAGKDPT